MVTEIFMPQNNTGSRISKKVLNRKRHILCILGTTLSYHEEQFFFTLNLVVLLRLLPLK